MKNKILAVSLLFIILITYILLNLKTEMQNYYKVLDVIRADLFYADINKNNKIDKNELFKLKDISTFSTELNNFAIYNSEKLHISKTDFLKAGFLAQSWAKDNLKGKYIEITSVVKDKTKNYDYITANFNGEDLSEFYLRNGLAFSKSNSDYSIYQNINQIKHNAKEISKLDFVIVNLKTGIYHKLNCEHVDLMRTAGLILAKNAKHYIPCKSCLDIFSKQEIQIPSKINFSTYKKSGDIELYLINPLIYKKPDNTCSNSVCKRIVSEIKSANSSIDMALYGFGEINEIHQAIQEAKSKGIKIRIVLDYSKKMNELYSKTSQLIKDFNAVTDKTEVIMHNKFFIIDNKKVITGSANISPSDIGGYSANSVIIINSPKIAKRYKDEFEQMYNGKFSVNKDRFAITTDKNITACFSPKDDIKNIILSKINHATNEILVSAFYLTNKDIISALINARKRNVKVYIILDAVGANNFKDRVYFMRKSGLILIAENWGGKDHEKTIMIDSKTLIMGSLNFSNAALNKNDENMLIIENSELAEFYRNYFFYLFKSIDKKFLSFIPRAEGKESNNSCNDGVDNNFDGKTDKDDDGCK